MTRRRWHANKNENGNGECAETIGRKSFEKNKNEKETKESGKGEKRFKRHRKRRRRYALEIEAGRTTMKRKSLETVEPHDK